WTRGPSRRGVALVDESLQRPSYRVESWHSTGAPDLSRLPGEWRRQRATAKQGGALLSVLPVRARVGRGLVRSPSGPKCGRRPAAETMTRRDARQRGVAVIEARCPVVVAK